MRPLLKRNPFCTARTRPGMVPFLFPNATAPGAITIAQVVHRFRLAGWQGQIVGPHGAGKSTLLASLLPQWYRSFPLSSASRFAAQQRHLPNGILAASDDTASRRLLVIDGFEQLSWWSRRRVRRIWQRRGEGLLVTSHHDVELPLLYRAQPSEKEAIALVEQLLDGWEAVIFREDVVQQFSACGAMCGPSCSGCMTCMNCAVELSRR